LSFIKLTSQQAMCSLCMATNTCYHTYYRPKIKINISMTTTPVGIRTLQDLWPEFALHLFHWLDILFQWFEVVMWIGWEPSRTALDYIYLLLHTHSHVHPKNAWTWGICP
jgi:hypothetical protein